MNVAFKNPRTNEIKSVKVGFSWVLFLLSSVLGIPLFLRKLNVLGGIFLLLWALNLVLGYVIPDPSLASQFGIGMFLLILILQIWLGIKGNELTAKNYLEHGWTFVDPEADTTRFGKMRWGLAG